MGLGCVTAYYLKRYFWAASGESRLQRWPELPQPPAKAPIGEAERCSAQLIHSLKSCLMSRLAYTDTLHLHFMFLSSIRLIFYCCFHLHQGSLPTGRQTRRFQVPASVQLRAVLRSPAAQREDEGGAGEGVQEGCGRGARPAGHRSLPVAGLLHPHTC